MSTLSKSKKSYIGIQFQLKLNYKINLRFFFFASNWIFDETK